MKETKPVSVLVLAVKGDDPVFSNKEQNTIIEYWKKENSTLPLRYATIPGTTNNVRDLLNIRKKEK